MTVNFESDSVWWEKIALEAILKGKDTPQQWNIIFDDGADGCIPEGWYVQGLNSAGWLIDWPTRHEYGPFSTETEARNYTAKIDFIYK